MKDLFHVGQRVRVNCPSNSDTHGRHATVIEIVDGWLYDVYGSRQFVHHYRVDVDAAGRIGRFGRPRGYAAPQLIPLYDGDEKTAWSESAWRPMHLRQDVLQALKKRGLSIKLPENVETK